MKVLGVPYHRFRTHNVQRATAGQASSGTRRNHDAMLGLYFAWYNFVRKHSTIKTTPAVAAKLASEPWSLEKLLTVAAAV